MDNLNSQRLFIIDDALSHRNAESTPENKLKVMRDRSCHLSEYAEIIFVRTVWLIAIL
jgi:hypothetical protein